MKITELLTQQDLNEAWYDPRTWGASKPAATPTSTGGKVAPTASGVVHKASKKNPNMPKDPASMFKWLDQKIANRNDLAVRKAAAIEKYEARAGAIGPILKALGIGALLINALVQLDALEEEYTKGTITKAEFQNAREWYIGMFEAQTLLPWLASKLQLTRVIGWVVRIIVSLATGGGLVAAAVGSGGLAAAPAAAAMIAEQAFFTWMQYFLTTEEARKWLATYFAIPILNGGKLLDGAWDSLTDYYKNADAKKATTPQAPNAVAAPAGGNPAIASTSQPASTATTAAQSAADIDAEYARNNATRIVDKDPKTGNMVVGYKDPKTGVFTPD